MLAGVLSCASSWRGCLSIKVMYQISLPACHLLNCYGSIISGACTALGRTPCRVTVLPWCSKVSVLCSQ